MKKKEDKELGFVIPKSVNGVVYNLTSMVEEIKKLLLELKVSASNERLFS